MVNHEKKKKTTGIGKPSAGNNNKARECSKCGKRHQPRSCQAFGKSCKKCKEPNHYAKVCQVRKQAINFFGKAANIEENNGNFSEYSYFIAHTDYIKNSAVQKIEVNGKKYQ